MSSVKIVLITFLMALAVSAAVFADVAPPPEAETVVGQEFTFVTKDGIRIFGTFYDAGNKKPVVLLLHMMRRDSKDWENFAFDLAPKGISSLAIDLRGHGKSKMREKGKDITLQNMSATDFKNMIMDAEVAMDFLFEQKINKKKIAIVGASIGGNVAINYAAKYPDKIKAVVMLSPGLNYRGIKTEQAMATYKGPVYLAAAKNDKYSAETVMALSKVDKNRTKTVIKSGQTHGTNMFAGHKDLAPDVINWLVKQLH